MDLELEEKEEKTVNSHSELKTWNESLKETKKYLKEVLSSKKGKENLKDSLTRLYGKNILCNVEDIKAVLNLLEENYQEGYMKGRKEEEKEMLRVIRNHYISKKKIENILEELETKNVYTAEPELLPHRFDNGMTSYHVVIPMIKIDEVKEKLQQLLEDK